MADHPILSQFLKLKKKDIMKMTPLNVLNLLNVIEELHKQYPNDEFITLFHKLASESVEIFKLTGTYYQEMKTTETQLANAEEDDINKLKKNYENLKSIFTSFNNSSYTSLEIMQTNMRMKKQFNISLL